MNDVDEELPSHLADLTVENRALKNQLEAMDAEMRELWALLQRTRPPAAAESPA